MIARIGVLPPSRSVLSEQVASQLEGLILAAEVAIGSKLPPEGALAAEFGVSRPVIREALAQLRDRGLTETVNGSGTYVRQPDSEHLTDVLLRQLHFGELAAPQVVERLYEARIAVEVMAARLAADRVLEEDMQLISARFEEMKIARHDPVAWIAADMGFHLAVVASAHNPFLGTFLKPMTRIIEQSMSESWRDPKAVRAGLLAHQAICDAIAGRDEKRAAQAMRDHLEDSKARLSSALVLPSDTRKRSEVKKPVPSTALPGGAR